MSRRKARETAVQALFYLDFNQTDPETALTAIIDEREDKISDNAKEYARILVTGTWQQRSAIDGFLSQVSAEWKLDRMAAVDRNIARIAVFEIKFGTEQLPPNVVINEAIELAKTFSDEKSARFVNGVLSQFVTEAE